MTTYYIKLPDGEPTRNLALLLPNTINPENLPVAEREAQGVYECVITQPTIEWWQQRGAEQRDTEARPVTITWAVEDRPIEDVRAMAKQRVDAERESRISGGMIFSGKSYQTDDRSRENIAGAAQMATLAVVLGGKALTDVYWTDDSEPFDWITADNTRTVMDPQTTIAFGQTLGGFATALIKQARTMKDAIEAAQTVAEIVAATEWPA